MTEAQAIRAAALAAAAHVWADAEADSEDVLEWAQEFADFIETGQLPS